MQNNRIVSVVIPVYNTNTDCLSACIESCLSQSIDDTEILIVDDGSTDEATIEYVHKIVRDNKDKVVYIRQENRGVSYARIHGATAGRGEYLVLVDSDDIIHSHFCEIMRNIMERDSVDMAACGSRRFYAGDNIDIHEELTDVCTKVYSDPKYLVGGRLGLSDAPSYYTVWAKMYRREQFIRNCRIYEDIQRGEDMISVLEYMSSSSSISDTPLELYYYNDGNAGSVTKIHDARQMSVAKAWDKIYDLCVEKEYDDMLDAAGKIAAESIIGVIAGAHNNHGASHIREYALMLKKYSGYKSKLSSVNRLKMDIMSCCPWVYVILGRIRER